MKLIFTMLLLLQAASQSVASEPKSLQFSITHNGAIAEKLSGRVYVMMTKGAIPPLGGPDWWNPEPFFAQDVEDWMSGEPLIINHSADNMGVPPSQIGEGPWKAVSVYRSQNDSCRLAAPGGLYGEAVIITNSPLEAGTISLEVNTPVPDREWKEHKNLRLDEKQSPMLSEFFNRDVMHGACVIVPDDYDQNRVEPYPVMYWIGGFNSDHYGGRFMKALYTGSDYDDQICRVVLNAQCYGGHHGFADSENNGPRLTALMQEFIPYLESKYNLGGSPAKRHISGHSSGGWASLWMLLNYPDFFRGAWALAPDPVDFRHFQTCDIYAENANVYSDAEGKERPVAREGESPILYYRGFTKMDDVIKDGGVVGSFEWQFSPRGDDGRPVHLFNRSSGKIDRRIAEYWKQYDILHQLKANWNTLSPKLIGKINIVAAEFDTFYFEDAVFAMNDFFTEEDFDAYIEIVEGGSHGDVFRTSVIRKMDEWFARTLQLTNNQSPMFGPEPLEP